MFVTAHDVRTCGTRFSKIGSLLPRAPTVETRSTELRCSSRCPRRHLVRAGLAMVASTVFLDSGAKEHSTFYID